MNKIEDFREHFDQLANEAIEEAEKPVPEDHIFDELRDLLNKAQELLYQAQAAVFQGKHSRWLSQK